MDITFDAFLIFLLVLLIAYPVVLLKLGHAIIKKNSLKSKKFTKQLILLLLFSGFVFRGLPGSNIFWWPFESIDSKIYTKQLTGSSFILKEASIEWHSQQHFNGDGSSIYQRELS